MQNRHTQIALSDASPGMTLSDDVLDTKGNILLPEGAVLTEQILASLQRHLIETVAIAGTEILEVEQNLQLERVQWLFRQPGAAPAGGQDAVPMPTATDVLYQYMMNFRAGAGHE